MDHDLFPVLAGALNLAAAALWPLPASPGGAPPRPATEPSAGPRIAGPGDWRPNRWGRRRTALTSPRRKDPLVTIIDPARTSGPDLDPELAPGPAGLAVVGRVLLEPDPRQLVENPHNSRTDLGDLAELTGSIRAVGVLEPLIATPAGDGRHVLLSVTAAAGQPPSKPGWLPCPLTSRPSTRAVGRADRGDHRRWQVVTTTRSLEPSADAMSFGQAWRRTVRRWWTAANRARLQR